MTIIFNSIKNAMEKYSPNCNVDRGVDIYSMIIAERKAFLLKRKLTYSCRIKVDEGTQIVKFSEILLETGSGLSTDGGISNGASGGFGFKTEIYNTLKGARQGTIEEQAVLFGKAYAYRFDYTEIRSRIRAIAENAGYHFEYQLLPIKLKSEAIEFSNPLF